MMGPVDSAAREVYLRAAVSVDREGWANFGYTKMPDYAGASFCRRRADRTIAFGDHKGEAVWQRVPGDYRAALRRLIVIQGDTEPASVEQQRRLGQTCRRTTISATSSRSTSRRAATSGRWSTCCTPGSAVTAEEAEALLERRSGDADRPRILGRLQRTDPGLARAVHVHLPHRPRRQVPTPLLAESAFDPLARTCRFMLTERRTTCSWASPDSPGWCSAPARSCAGTAPARCESSA